jgi:hypothetical protein
VTVAFAILTAADDTQVELESRQSEISTTPTDFEVAHPTLKVPGRASTPFVALSAGLARSFHELHALNADVYMIIAGEMMEEPARATRFLVDAPFHRNLPRIGRTKRGDGVDRSRHAGTLAWDELAGFLSLRNSDIAKIVGISEQTYYNWHRHPETVPKPQSLRNLLRLRAAMRTLISGRGSDAALTWFVSGSPSRIDRMVEAAGIEVVLSEAQSTNLANALERLKSGRSDSSRLRQGQGDVITAQRIEE